MRYNKDRETNLKVRLKPVPYLDHCFQSIEEHHLEAENY